MSLVKIAAEFLSSTSGLPYIDSHVGITKALGLGTRATKRFRYSKVQPALDALVDSSVEYFPIVNEITQIQQILTWVT